MAAPLPPAEAPEASEAAARQAAISASVDATFARPLPILLMIAGSLTILTSPWTAEAVGGVVGLRLVILYVLLGVLVIALGAWMRDANPPPTFSYAAVALLSIAYLAADLTFVRLGGQVQFNSELWLLLGAGFVILRTPWLHPVMVATAGGWLVLFSDRLDDPIVQQYGFQVMAGIVFGYIAHFLRRASVHRIATVRLGEADARATVDRTLMESRAAEQRLRTLTEGSPLGIFQTDARGIVVYANRRWCEIAGCDYRDFEAIRRAVHDDDRDALTTAWRASLANESELLAEFRYVHKDGQVRNVTTRAMPLRDEQGKLTGFTGTLEDITNQRTAQRELAEAEQRNRQLVDSIRDYAIYMLDAEGHIVSWNAGAERMKGYTEAEAVGRHVAIFHTTEDVSKGGPQACLAAAAATGRSETEGERVRRDGSRFVANTILTALRTDAGHLKGFSVVTRDITASRQAAQADRVAFERLLQIEQLKEMDRFKTQVLSTASHELNTPITPLKLQLHMLRSGAFGPLTPEQTKSVAILERNAERLAALISDILDVSRMQAGHLRLHPAYIDLRQSVQEATDAFTEPARAADVAIDIKLDGDLHVVADAQRVSQVLDNLLSNAIKFTPKKGHITIGAERADGEVEVRVIDTGLGMVPEQIGRLFQPFSQVHDATKIQRPGTGLGLYISKGIVNEHGGVMDVQSAGPGKGTTFWFRLPVRGPPTQAVTEAKDAAAAA